MKKYKLIVFDYDFRFCLYGTLIQGPALYCWMRVANKMYVILLIYEAL